MRCLRWMGLALLMLLLLLVGLAGCGSPPPAEKKVPVSETPVAQAKARSPRLVTDKVLVQVLIYGLAAINREHDGQGNLTGLSAHLPIADEHELKMFKGTFSGQYDWKEVEDGGRIVDIAGSTLHVKMSGPLEETRGATIGAYPANEAEAADVGWMLEATKIDDVTAFDESYGSAHVLFDHGTLETCALAFSPQSWNHACRVRVDNPKKVERSVSELMVIRGWVDKAASGQKTKVEVQLTGSTNKSVLIEETGGAASVTWNGETYTTIINLAIGNYTPPSKREMRSDHANHLKPFFTGASLSWNLESSSDCVEIAGKWVCNGCQVVQPTCFAYFQLLGGSPSGVDRPICPLVGYP